MRFKTKPVELHAFKWEGSIPTGAPDWLNKGFEDGSFWVSGMPGRFDFVARTRHGVQHHKPGDYLLYDEERNDIHLITAYFFEMVFEEAA